MIRGELYAYRWHGELSSVALSGLGCGFFVGLFNDKCHGMLLICVHMAHCGASGFRL